MPGQSNFPFRTGRGDMRFIQNMWDVWRFSAISDFWIGFGKGFLDLKATVYEPQAT